MMMKSSFIRIAVADDDEDDQMLFEMALNEVNKDAVLEQYFDGRHLMETLMKPGTVLPDIIFLDLNMPRKDGFQCIEEISTNEKLKNIPVIILTTSTNMADKKKAFERGARLYSHKPSDFIGLINLIKNIFIMDLSFLRLAAH